MIELAYPAFAFVMVLCVPTFIATWVICKTWKPEKPSC